MIELINLTKKFGDLVAVDHLNLTIEPGEVFGFLGPNGAGKTTTIKMISGILLPSEGTVKIKGHDILAYPEKAKSLIGFIPDTPFIYDKLTGWEFIDFAGALYSLTSADSRRKAQQWIEIFRIDHAMDRLIESFSHGMKQKLVVTSALLHDPPIIVVDEPMVGLDPRSSEEVKTLFRSVAERGGTVFLSTHTLNLVEVICDRVGIIQKGTLTAMGTMQELRQLAQEETSGAPTETSGAPTETSDLQRVFLKLTEEENDCQTL